MSGITVYTFRGEKPEIDGLVQIERADPFVCFIFDNEGIAKRFSEVVCFRIRNQPNLLSSYGGDGPKMRCFEIKSGSGISEIFKRIFRINLENYNQAPKRYPRRMEGYISERYAPPPSKYGTRPIWFSLEKLVDEKRK